MSLDSRYCVGTGFASRPGQQELGIPLTGEMPILTYDLALPISPDTASHYVRDIADKAEGIDTHLHTLGGTSPRLR